MPADSLLHRLDGVRNVGEGRWIARCPAHQDRDPSLSVRELPDGRVLVHCHAGCGAVDVMASVGLSMTDLFPDGPTYHHGRRVLRQNEARAYHESVVEIAAADLARGQRLSRDDISNLKAARNWLGAHPETEDWK